jgi:ATP-binding cassette subfamily B protein/subfamily B ATP-binding cassette protein MsbA
MKHFWKPIRLSLRYKWTLLASVLNALVIGVLWGASITTVYPFVEIVFQGETAESWLAREAEAGRQRIARFQQEIWDMDARLREAADTRQRKELTVQRALTRSRCDAEQRNVEYLLWLRPRLAGVSPRTPFGTLALLMTLLILATILKGVCLVLNVVLVARVANRTAMDMRRIFYRAALRMDQQEIDRLGTTALMTQLSHNVNLVTAGLGRLYGQSVREPLKMLACLIGAACISWQLLVVSLLVAPLGGYVIHQLARQMKQAARKEMGGITAVFQTLIETLEGIKIVRIYTRERREMGRFKQNAATLYRLSMRMAFFDSLPRPITELVGIKSLVVAVLCGAYLVLNQETHLFGIPISDRPLSASALFVFFGMLAGISDPARKMGDIYNVLFRAAVASESLFSTFERKPRIVACTPAVKVPLHRKHIRFENVSFAYQPGEFVLQNVSFEIPYGQCVALVGENGCGKSTLVNLLARFYDPNQGNIYLDGVNLRNVNPQRLRRQIGMVTQDPVLFRGTIRDNMVYGNPQAKPLRQLYAARLARVESFVRDLPFGYRNQVGDHGNRLSGGQRQRIALARAVVKYPKILILDEATSQIDREAEAEIHEGLREFLAARTTLMITHRASLLELAERVIVLEKGCIVGDMTPSEYFASSRCRLELHRAAS